VKAEMGRAVFCIVRKSPGLHTAIAQSRHEREALLLSPKAGPEAFAPRLFASI
jgi:hypothetical protein